MRAPLRGLDTLGDQLAFYLRAAGWMPATVRRYRREVLRLLAEVSFGTGALAVVGGTVGVIAFLAFFTGTEVGCRGTPRSTSWAPPPTRASSRRTSTPARSRR